MQIVHLIGTFFKENVSENVENDESRARQSGWSPCRHNRTVSFVAPNINSGSRLFSFFFPFIKTIRHALYLRKNSDLRKASQVGRKVGKKCVTINFFYRVSNSKVMIRRTMLHWACRCICYKVLDV